MKIQKKIEGGVGSGGWGHGRCEQRSKVFVKIQQKQTFFGGWGSSRGGVKVDVNEELIFFSFFFFLGGGGRVGGDGLGVRVDVNREVKFL